MSFSSAVEESHPNCHVDHSGDISLQAQTFCEAHDEPEYHLHIFFINGANIITTFFFMRTVASIIAMPYKSGSPQLHVAHCKLHIKKLRYDVPFF